MSIWNRVDDYRLIWQNISHIERKTGKFPRNHEKKNCIWSSWFWVLYGHKFPLETSCWCFRRLSSGTLETINFLLYEPSYTIGVGNRELLRHHKFQHLLKIFLKLPALSLKHFPNLLNNFNNTAHHTHKRTNRALQKRKKLQTICCRWRCGWLRSHRFFLRKHLLSLGKNPLFCFPFTLINERKYWYA